MAKTMEFSLLHSERPKLLGVLAILSAIGLNSGFGHSECNRVKLYGVLAVLRAIGFKSMEFWPF